MGFNEVMADVMKNSPPHQFTLRQRSLKNSQNGFG